ncbi:MAG: BMC domain-containing protein [Desulfobacterales bacterium]|nr:BMC domain-containing protein [Desulfobacterales bacterium]
MKDISAIQTLGLVETRTIARGVALTDAMVKAADVRLLRGRPICSGRYMIQISGDEAGVKAALDVAQAENPFALCRVSRVSGEVLAAMGKTRALGPGMALGLLESRKSITGIKAADAAVKAAQVRLARITLAQGINGKSYLVMGGSVSAVSAAVDAGAQALGKDLVDRLVIASPDDATVRSLCPLDSEVHM